MKEINLHHQRVQIPNQKYNAAQDLWWTPANITFRDLVQILKYKEQIRDMFDHGKLREVVDNLEDKKDNRRVNFTTKYTISESEDIIDLTLTEDNITEALESDDESHLIMIRSEEESISSDEEVTLISSQLKG